MVKESSRVVAGEARHVAMLPSPAMGHLFPFTELAKLLVSRGGFSVTFITFAAASSSSSARNAALLRSLPANSVTSVELPPPADDDETTTTIQTRLSAAAARSTAATLGVLLELKRSTNLVALVADVFCADVLSAAREHGVAPYLFFSSNLHALSMLLHLPELDAATPCEFRDLPEPVQLPGCMPIAGADLMEPMNDRASESYPLVVHLALKSLDAQGIIVNSFDELEPGVAEALRRRRQYPPVYAIGPLVRAVDIDDGDDDDDDDDGGSTMKMQMITEWLDRQPRETVLFVCFGSGGALSTEQTTELAAGLEMSGQRFLWVVGRPSVNDVTDPSANFFGGAEDAAAGADPLAFLPEGFVERTKEVEVGMVVPKWAPQAAVLAHAATGGFLTHCGWNSALESLASGVPMIAWPLFAEQRMNAVVLDVGAGVALCPASTGTGGVYRREEIARVVKELMEGEGGRKAREKAKELRRGGASAMADGGSSRVALAEVMKEWSSNNSLGRQFNISSCPNHRTIASRSVIGTYVGIERGV